MKNKNPHSLISYLQSFWLMCWATTENAFLSAAPDIKCCFISYHYSYQVKGKSGGSKVVSQASYLKMMLMSFHIADSSQAHAGLLPVYTLQCHRWDKSDRGRKWGSWCHAPSKVQLGILEYQNCNSTCVWATEEWTSKKMFYRSTSPNC